VIEHYVRILDDGTDVVGQTDEECHVVTQTRRTCKSPKTHAIYTKQLTGYSKFLGTLTLQGRRHGFESGGDKFCERSEQKFFDPHFLASEGQHIA